MYLLSISIVTLVPKLKKIIRAKIIFIKIRLTNNFEFDSCFKY